MRTGQIASLLAVLGVTACVESKTTPCGDDNVCPANMECRVLVDPEPDRAVCVTVNQLAACGESLDRTACTLGDGAGSVVGTCFDGACFPQVCGDEIVDVTEACDVGDRVAGDGCSANCLSREVCGDLLVDLAIGEQCDEGLIGLSGDGCSSKCSNEFDLWRDITPRSPGVRSDASLAAAPGGGVMIFGGTPGLGNASASSALADAWRWDGVSWSPLVPATESPPPRASASAAYDPKSRSFLVFGGKGADAAPLNDLWRWDGVTWIPMPSTNAPPARWNASMACSNTRCIVYGGRTDGGMLGDTWVWNGTTWSPLTGAQPPARSRGALACDAAGDVFLLFGGVDPAARQDTWEMTGTQWSQKVTGRYPPAVPQPAATFDSTAGEVLVVAGTETWVFDNDDWTNRLQPFSQSLPALAYDVGRGTATAVGPTSSVLERAGAAWTSAPNQNPSATPLALLSAYDPRRGRTLVVESGATWEWDARSWRRVTIKTLPTPHPSPTNAAIAFDVACDRAVLFGGGVGAVGQTWSFSNGAWTQNTISGPPARSLHAMTYDAKREVVVVFGGLDTAIQPLRDVWELRGPCSARAWVQVPTTVGPSARASARLAFDAARGVSVLFGGSVSGQQVNDTWEWDGTSWTSRAPTTKPPARKDHVLGYAPRRGTIVMFGGGTGTSFLDDSWTWDGAEWTQLAPITVPPARQAMTMAIDSTGGLVIFGGESDAPGLLADVWRLDAQTADEPVERCLADGADDDGDGLTSCDDPDCGLRCAPLCPFATSCSGPTCGDGTCSPVEDYMLCPADCMAP